MTGHGSGADSPSSAATYRCPDSGTVLIEERAAAGSRWVCPDCGGAAFPKAVLVAELVADSLAEASDASPATRRCPRCGGEMKVGSVATDPPGGTSVEICETCSLVWLDARDRAMVPMRVSPDLSEALSSVGAFAAPERCPSCGAPWQLVDGSRCRWCGAALIAVAPPP